MARRTSPQNSKKDDEKRTLDHLEQAAPKTKGKKEAGRLEAAFGGQAEKDEKARDAYQELSQLASQKRSAQGLSGLGFMVRLRSLIIEGRKAAVLDLLRASTPDELIKIKTDGTLIQPIFELIGEVEMIKLGLLARTTSAVTATPPQDPPKGGPHVSP